MAKRVIPTPDNPINAGQSDRAVPIPTLDEVAADPQRAQNLPPDVSQALTWKCLTALTALHVCALASGSRRPANTMACEAGERLLTVSDVAARIVMSVSWVEKHTADLPARVSVVGNPRWRKSDVDRWIKNRPQYGGVG